MAATLSELRRYCGIDIDDDELINANLTRALAAAHSLVLGAVGDDIEDYLPGDPRLDELTLAYAQELYSSRGISAKAANAQQAWIFSLEEQLRLELRRAKRGTET